MGLGTFLGRFSQVAHRVAREKLVFFVKSLPRDPRYTSLYETSPTKVTM